MTVAAEAPETIFSYGYSASLLGEPKPAESREVGALRRFMAAYSASPWIGTAIQRWFDANRDSVWEGVEGYETAEDDSREARIALIRRRLEALQAAEQEAWEERYGQIKPDGVAGALGSVAAAITDPTILPLYFVFPAAGALRASMAAGGAIGGTAVAAQQLGTEGQISAVDVMVGTGMGALLAGVLSKAPQLLTRAPKAVLQHAAERADDPAFARLQTHLLEARISHPIEQLPASPTSAAIRTMFREVWDEGLKRAGISEGQAAEIVRRTGRVPVIPETRSEAVALLHPTKAINPGLASRALMPALDTLERIAPMAAGRLVSTYFETQRLGHLVLERGVTPLVRAYQKLGPQERAAFHLAALNGNRAQIAQLVGDDALRGWERWSRHLFQAAKPDVPEVPGFYMPRYLEPQAARELRRDEGFRRWLAGRTETDELLVQYYLLRQAPTTVPRATSLRERTIERITPDHANRFLEFPEAAVAYVQRMAHEAWVRQFFGRHLQKTKVGDVDLTASSARLLAPVPEHNRRVAAELIKTVLEGPQLQQARPLAVARNLSYAGILGSFTAAAVQTGDIGIVLAAHGFRDGIAALVGRKFMRAVDWGITNASVELAASPSRSARLMEASLKWSGFTRLDVFGKEAHLNGAIRHFMRASRTADGRAELTRLYGKQFADVWPKVIQDLQNGVASTDVKLLALYRLASLQPVGPFSMPPVWLQHPNARLFYMLKTFALRSTTFALNEVRRRGTLSPRQAAQFATGFVALWALAGLPAEAIKVMLRGGDIDAETVADSAFDNMMSLWGGSSFIVHNFVLAGRLDKAFAEVLSPPPLTIAAAIGTDIVQAAKQGDLERATLYGRTASYVPIAGRIYYHLWGGGAERMATEYHKQLSRPAARNQP